MNTIKAILRRFTPAGRLALRKRRLEALLRDEGLSRSTARRIVAVYFNDNR